MGSSKEETETQELKQMFQPISVIKKKEDQESRGFNKI
jgi:hypothetical protein